MRQRGVVSAFDERTGIGVVTTTDGSELTFHAVAIADGSRSIAVGTEVSCEVVPALLGRWEADAVEPAVEDRAQRDHPPPVR